MDTFTSLRYEALKTQAKNAGKELKVNRNEYELLLKEPCYFCGKHADTSETGSGVVRVNKLVGYSVDNLVRRCVPCWNKTSRNGGRKKAANVVVCEENKKYFSVLMKLPFSIEVSFAITRF